MKGSSVEMCRIFTKELIHLSQTEDMVLLQDGRKYKRETVVITILNLFFTIKRHYRNFFVLFYLVGDTFCHPVKDFVTFYPNGILSS